MPTYVKTDYVPEDMMDYITPNKEYEILQEEVMYHNGGFVIMDDNERHCVCYDECEHLDNRAWTVINRP